MINQIKILKWITSTRFLIFLSLMAALSASYYSFVNDYILTYGDAESHLNIAKRVIDSLTPGFSQLGGIWLPLPHLFFVPFVFFDPLWRLGIAGTVVNGFFFVIAAVCIYKLAFLITQQKFASLIGFLGFITNPNILYLQSTAMTELPLIAFFILSSYFFIRIILGSKRIIDLILAAFFGFAATLTRYDGWFLVLIEAFILLLMYFSNIKQKLERRRFEGRLFIFSTLAFFGILIWLIWDYLILGDPFYFTNSPFSANSQQQGWLLKGQLPTYHNLLLSIIYYSTTSLRNIGVIISIASLIGFIFYLFKLKSQDPLKTISIILLLIVPFIFYITTLFIGQSVIFIPELTPKSFQWNLFNVRYGVMMVPISMIFLSYLARVNSGFGKYFLVLILTLQISLFTTGFESVISFEDGVVGLSHAVRPDVENWLAQNYDSGLILIDDYARTASIIRSNLPMNKVIYIGNKPYWEEGLKEPEKKVRWIVMQKNDAVWQKLYETENQQQMLYKYYEKAYTSPEILVFKRSNTAIVQN